MRIILPQNPLFQETLDNVPFFWKAIQKDFSDQLNFVVNFDSGLLRLADHRETEEYLLGGEYDALLNKYEEQEEVNQCLGLQPDLLSQILIDG